MNGVKMKELNKTNESLIKYSSFVLLILSFLAFVFLGIFKEGFSGEMMPDFAFYYAAGKCWWNGGSMWNYEALTKEFTAIRGYAPGGNHGLAYPPLFVPFTLLYGYFDITTAKCIHLVLILMSLSTVCYIAIRTTLCDNKLYYSQLFIVALIFGNPFTLMAVHLGQASIFVFAASFLGWYLIYKHKEYFGGACLAFAAIKPQFVVLPLIWILLDKKFRAIGSFIGVSLILSSYSFYVLGPIESISQWLHCLFSYGEVAGTADVLGSIHVIGLPSFLVALGAPVIGKFGILGCLLLLTMLLFRFRAHFDDEYIFPLLNVMFIGLCYGHNPDMLFLLSALPVFWPIKNQVGRKELACSLAFLLVLFIPQKAMLLLGWPLLAHWRTILILVLGVLLVRKGLKKCPVNECSTG
jgi:hypothetical protein